MSFTIKTANKKNIDVVSMALQAGGEALSGANTSNTTNRIELHGDIFTLPGQWFNGNPQNLSTIKAAVTKAAGIELQFDEQSRSSGPTTTTISSYKIVDQQQYDAAVGRQANITKKFTSERHHS